MQADVSQAKPQNDSYLCIHHRFKQQTECNTTENNSMHGLDANTRYELGFYSVAIMPRAAITSIRLHDVAVRAADAARQKVAAITGHECDEDIRCAFIDPLTPICAKDVVEFKWTHGNQEVSIHLRAGKALYCKCVGPPRKLMTSLVAASALKGLRQQTPAWMQEEGSTDIVVDAIAAPKAIDKLPLYEEFNIGEAQATFFRCARIEGDRWLCSPAEHHFHPSRLLEIDVETQAVAPGRPHKKRQQCSNNKTQLEIEHIMACAAWNAEQLRAAKHVRDIDTNDAESGFLKNPIEWHAGRARFTVVLWRSYSGGKWQHHLTPASLLDLIKDLKPMASS